jgi:hypothetical protein
MNEAVPTVELQDRLLAEVARVLRPGAALVAGAAASDAELNRYVDELFAGVTDQIRRILTILRDRGWLRDDVPLDELVVTSTVLSGIETFLRVTRRDGWSVARYRSWLRRTAAETIWNRSNLCPAPANAPNRPASRRTSGEAP